MTTSPQSSTSRAVIGVAAVALLLVLAGTVWLGVRLATSDSGPVDAAHSTLSYTAAVGEEVGFSAIELRNTGDRAAIIESVEPVDPPIGLDVHGARAYSPKADQTVEAVTPYPESIDGRDAPGTRLPPRAATSVKLALLAQGTRPGRYTVEETIVRYRVGDDHHALTVPAGLSLCATAVEGGSCR